MKSGKLPLFIFWSVSILFLIFGCGKNKVFHLTEAGKSPYVIVLPDSASLSEKFAAGELQHFIKLSSGVELPIISENEPRASEPARILVGKGKISESLIGAGKPVNFDSLGDEGFIVRTEKNKDSKYQDILIAGGRLRGTMYGVYSLLDTLGFKWYTNTKTWLPKDTTIAVMPLDMKSIPAFFYRDPCIYEGLNKDWETRNRVNSMSADLDSTRGGKTGIYGGHSFNQFIPQSLYKEHPEYFPLIGGKRVTGYVQRCLTNPEVVKIAAENMIKFMDEHPEQKIFSLSQEDCVNYCECPNCMKIMDEQGAPSGLYVDFINKVAEIVEKKHPDKFISTFAYWFTEKPPKTMKPRQNVIIELCPIKMCDCHPLKACSDTNSVNFYKNLTGWAKLTDRIILWHYLADFRQLQQPFPNFKEFPEDFRTYYENGVRGIYCNGSSYGPGSSDSDLRAWVLARILWNPYQDSDALVNEWMHAVYGNAYAPMRAVFDLTHSLYASPDRHLHLYEQVLPEVWTDKVVATMDSLHESALKLAAGDSTATYYIGKNRISVKFLQLDLGKGCLKVDNGQYKPVGNTKTTDDYNAFMEYVKGYGVTNLREDDSNTTLIDLLRQRFETHPVVSIENDELKIEAVPNLGGRLVSIIYKKTGENLLSLFDPTYNYYPACGGYEDLTDGPKSNPAKHEATVKGRMLTLTGMRNDNLLFTRTITLPPSGAKIDFVSTIVNKNKTPQIFRLVCRANYIADPNASEFTVRKKDGTFVKSVPSFSEELSFRSFRPTRLRYDGAYRPVGALRLDKLVYGLSVEQNFEDSNLESVLITAYGPQKVTRIDLFTPEREVPPDGKITLKHSMRFFK